MSMNIAEAPARDLSPGTPAETSLPELRTGRKSGWKTLVYNAAHLMRNWQFSFVLAVIVSSVSVSATAQRGMDDADLEVKMGEQVYRELEAKGEILHESKLYETLNPIAAAIKNVVQPKYDHPFKFYLVHESQPNAFAAPGGNVYVTDSLMYFVKNTEQLAGTICHETSHTLHHDAVNLMKQDEQIKRRAMAAEILMERRGMEPMAVPVVAKLRTLGYSREAESRADLTGADTCAAAGYNPWGACLAVAGVRRQGIAAKAAVVVGSPE
jgi:predicted Zn-dependent protease